jgi:hypothetical protein
MQKAWPHDERTVTAHVTSQAGAFVEEGTLSTYYPDLEGRKPENWVRFPELPLVGALLPWFRVRLSARIVILSKA